MEGTRSTHGEKMNTEFWSVNFKRTCRIGNTSVDGRMILKWILGW